MTTNEKLRSKLESMTVEKPDIKEDNEDGRLTLEKFYRDKPYNTRDISSCIQDKDVYVLNNIYGLGPYLEKNSDKDLLKIVCDISVFHWVLLYIEKTEGGKKYDVYYKNPDGKDVTKDFKQTIQKVFSREEFQPKFEYFVNRNNDVSIKKDENKLPSDYTGAICVRNIDKMNLNREDFSKISFTTMRDLQEEKLKMAQYLASEMAKHDQDFISILHRIKRALPTSLMTGVGKYREYLSRYGKNVATSETWEDCKKMRSQYIRNEDMLSVKVDKNELSAALREMKQEKFRKILAKFRKFMYLLSNCSESKATSKDYLKDIKELIASLFQFDYTQLVDIKKETDSIEEDQLNIAGPQKFDVEGKQIKNEDGKSLKDLIEELTQENPEEDFSKIKTLFGEIMKKVKLMETLYPTPLTVLQWAKANKLNQNLFNEENFTETMAIVIRGFSLVRGYNIRTTHLLTLLFLMTKGDSNGHICEVKTGEGKTNIIALLAILKVFQQKKVDVCTSNMVLAEEGVNDTRDIYRTFDVSVDHNNPISFEGDIRDCYTKDVVYGSMSAFQFDYLKDKAEGFDNRSHRGFEELILDEVDNMLIDNGGYIAKLAEPFPGMESLRYLYIYIWIALKKAEEEQKQKIEHTIPDDKFGETETSEKEEEKLKSTFQCFDQNQTNALKLLTKKHLSKEESYARLPSWIKTYADENLDSWIGNAIHAKYSCQENINYKLDVESNERKQFTFEDEEVEENYTRTREDEINKLMCEDDQEKKAGKWRIIPLDYENTGVSLTNTVWSDALHQFVEIKHNVYVSFESLTSSYISNIGYVDLFKQSGGNITGLSGTVGSDQEQSLLRTICEDVDFLRMPTFKNRIFDKHLDLVVPDPFWEQTVLTEALKYLLNRRAVLVICETVQDVHLLQAEFCALQSFGIKPTVKKYYTEQHAKENKYDVDQGYVILATNLAGRGTDFKTTKELNDNGGLHVIVGFLPCNERVQEQAFGRTSRTGKKGSANIVMRRSEALRLVTVDDIRDLPKIFQKRKEIETQRLKEIETKTVKEIKFGDKLFEEFANYYLKQKKAQSQKGGIGTYIMMDFKERWAFWLKKQNFSYENIVDKTAKYEFDKFIRNHNIGKIINPYYNIAVARDYIDTWQLREAREVLNRIQNKNANDIHLFPCLHFTLFQYSVQLEDALSKAVSQAFKNIFTGEDPDPEKQYKSDAVKHLTDAQNSLEDEINFLQRNFLGEESQELPNIPKDFQSILKIKFQSGEENSIPIINHLNSRRIYLYTFHKHAKDLLTEINGTFLHKSQDFFMQLRTSGRSLLQKKNAAVYVEELNEFATIKLDMMLSIKAVRRLNPVVTGYARTAIYAGLALIPAACFCPILIDLTVTLIVDGVCDVIIYMMQDEEDDAKFSFTTYILEKMQTIGSAVFFTFLQSAKVVKLVLQEAISACNKVENILSKFPKFRKLATAVEDFVKEIRIFLQKALKSAVKVTNHIPKTPWGALQSIGKGAAKGITKKLQESVGDKVLKDQLHRIVTEFVQREVLNYITSDDHFKKLLTNTYKTPQKIVDLCKKCLEEAKAKECMNNASVFIANAGNKIFAMLNSTMKSANDFSEIVKLLEIVMAYLKQNLEGTQIPNDKSQDELDSALIQTARSITEAIMEKLCNIFKDWKHYAQNPVWKPDIKFNDVFEPKPEKGPKKPPINDNGGLSIFIADHMYRGGQLQDFNEIFNKIKDIGHLY